MAFLRLFAVMPLAALVQGKTLVLHGGARGVLAPEAAAGAEGFLLRGPVWPSSEALFWTVVQAVVSVMGVGLMVRAYQLAEASRVSIFEYVILPFSAAWSWVLWGQGISLVAALGMVLIIVAGAAMTLHGRGAR